MPRRTVLRLAMALHETVGAALSLQDWDATVRTLELLGDLHRVAGTGIAAMSYRRALSIATAKAMPSSTSLRAKLERERQVMPLT